MLLGKLTFYIEMKLEETFTKAFEDSSKRALRLVLIPHDIKATIYSNNGEYVRKSGSTWGDLNQTIYNQYLENFIRSVFNSSDAIEKIRFIKGVQKDSEMKRYAINTLIRRIAFDREKLRIYRKNHLDLAASYMNGIISNPNGQLSSHCERSSHFLAASALVLH